MQGNCQSEDTGLRAGNVVRPEEMSPALNVEYFKNKQDNEVEVNQSVYVYVQYKCEGSTGKVNGKCNNNRCKKTAMVFERVPAVGQPGDGRFARHCPLLQVRNFIELYNTTKYQSIPQIHGHWRLCWQRHCWSLLLLVPDRSHWPPDVLLAAEQVAVLQLPRIVQVIFRRSVSKLLSSPELLNSSVLPPGTGTLNFK